MIEVIDGDIFNSYAEAIVNPVNCVGIMGKGLALQFKYAYYDNFLAYQQACSRNELSLGHVHVFKTGYPSPRFIINAPTKKHWKEKSSYTGVAETIKDIARVVKKYNISSIAIPPLGYGLGGLDWNIVSKDIINTFSGEEEDKDLTVYLYKPKEQPY